MCVITAVKAVFDEHSLFPKELLDLRDGLSHGDLRNNREERKECRERKTGKGRSRKDRLDTTLKNASNRIKYVW